MSHNLKLNIKKNYTRMNYMKDLTPSPQIKDDVCASYEGLFQT